MTPPDSRELANLRRRAQPLRPRITIGRAGLNEAQVAQVRQALATHPLLKVRVGSADRETADAIGRRLAESVPCILVGRLGFVLTLYDPRHDTHPPAGAAGGEARDERI